MKLNHQETPLRIMKNPSKLLKIIKENRKFLIVSHINPEGDAIASGIALALGLKKLGKYAYILSKDPLPETLKFLPDSDLINTRIPSMNFDVLIMIDCNSIERTGFSGPGGSNREEKQLRAKTTAVIDHHLLPQRITRYDSPKPSGQQSIRWIEPNASATGELIYKLLNLLHVQIDKKIAINLYTAIFTDTGGFRYSNTSIETLRIASKLIEAGANTWEITKEVYENIPINYFRLLTLTLATLEKKGKIAWITVTRRMLRKTNTTAQATEDFADRPRKIKGVEVGIFFRQDGKNLYKVSLRSKGAVNVAYIAKVFGGGGHANAAGCILKDSLKDVQNKVFQAVRKEIRNQNTNGTHN